MRIKFGLILLLLVICNQSFSQKVGVSHQQRISGQKIYNKETGKRINDKELQNLININPNIVLEPCINKYGKIESFELDPNRTNRVLQRDVFMRTEIGEEFPEFVMQTIEHKSLRSEKLKGKNILLQFQLRFTEPFFRETTLKDFNNLVNEFKKTMDIEAIVVTESSKQEILKNIDIDNYDLKIVPNGRNFNQRYLLVKFPSVVLIDVEGKLVGYYNQGEIPKLRTAIESINKNNQYLELYLHNKVLVSISFNNKEMKFKVGELSENQLK